MNEAILKLRAACSLSRLLNLATVRPKCNWWLARRTPLGRRLLYWLLAPHKLHHGVDGYLYTRLRHLINCHPRYWWPSKETHYGVRHLWVGPLHFVWGRQHWEQGSRALRVYAR